MRALMSMHSACVCWRWQRASTRTKSAQIRLRSTVVLARYVPLKSWLIQAWLLSRLDASAQCSVEGT